MNSDGVGFTRVGIHNDSTDECENMVDNPMKVKVGTTITLPTCGALADGGDFVAQREALWGDGDLESYDPGTEYTVTKNVTLEYGEPQS